MQRKESYVCTLADYCVVHALVMFWMAQKLYKHVYNWFHNQYLTACIFTVSYTASYFMDVAIAS